MAEKKGFSLIELLVVMALIGLMASLIAPNVIKLFNSYKRATEIQTFKKEIESLSVLAFASEQKITIRLLDNKLKASTPDKKDIYTSSKDTLVFQDAELMISSSGVVNRHQVIILKNQSFEAIEI